MTESLLNFEEPKKGETVAVLDTDCGAITVRFFEQAAPKAVENFVTHAKDGYYDGMIFHRVIRDFMIQSGDPEGTGRGGDSIWGKAFENEVTDAARNFRGALAMANAGPDTNRSQFYIVQAGAEHLTPGFFARLEDQSGIAVPEAARQKYLENGGAPWLDGGYTVFGQVVAGMDAVDGIASVRVGPGDRPVEPVHIKSVRIETY